MKKNFTFLVAALAVASVAYGQKTADISMGPQYANDVFFGLEDGATKVVDRAVWDIAFYRKSAYAMGIRINDAKGIEVFEASDDIEDWNSIAIADLDNWTDLYNSATEWGVGAFDNGSATYGWGEYQMSNHKVVGSIVFVLKYQSGEYIKFKMKEYFGGYTFTYSKWDGSSWGVDVTKTIANNASENRIFNYYNFLTEAVIDVEPAQAVWDLKFTKYITPLPYQGGTMMYTVTGVLQSDLVKVAKEEQTNPFSADINSIGYDWKTFNMSNNTYTINNKPFFVKKSSDEKVYKLTMKEFAGSATGNIKFEYEEAKLSLSDLNTRAAGVYTTGQPQTFQVVLNGKTAWTEPVEVKVYSIAGQLIHQENYNSSANFSTKTIQLTQAPKGVYIVKITSGNFSESKKIILK